MASFSTINSLGSNVSGAVGDIFAGFGDEYKAEGARIEQGMYTEAAAFAAANVKYTEIGTSIKEAQQQRELQGSLGATNAAVAGAGFESSGSALDILRDSASQGALQQQVTGFQGQITEAGYKEQADALSAQAAAAGVAAQAAEEASKGSFISAGIKGLTAIASIAAL